MVVAFALLASLGLPAVANADSFIPGNIVVYRDGTGAAALSSNSAPVALDEYGPSGGSSPVMSVTVPSTGTTGGTGNHPLTASGTAGSEGLLTLSPGGQYLAFTGYDAPAGTTGVVGLASTATPRDVGIVGTTGAVNTTTALTDFASGNNPRSAVTSDGSRIWVTGAAGGIRTTTVGSSTSTTLTSANDKNFRDVSIAGGQLYVSADPTKNTAGYDVATVGTGTPTTGTLTPVNLYTNPSSGSPYQYALLTLGSGTAPDTLYVADNGLGQIVKWSLNGSTWTKTGTVTLSGVTGLTANDVNGTVTIYATVTGSGGGIYKVTDASGQGGTLSGVAQEIVTTPTNESFQGIAFAPGTIIGSGSSGGTVPPGPSISPADTSLEAVMNPAPPVDANVNPTLSFTIADPNYSASQLTTSASSSKPSVGSNPTVTCSPTTPSNCTLSVTPGTAVGISIITITVSEPSGGASTSTSITYGLSGYDGDPSDVYYTGAGNLSSAIEVGGGYFIGADDNDNILRLYQEGSTGAPVKTFDFTGSLPYGTASADLEAAAEASYTNVTIGNQTVTGTVIFWEGSMSNSSSGGPRPSASTVFATLVSGSGASTNLTYLGSYSGLRADLLSWDAGNANQLHFNQASTGNDKSSGGFNLEGMEFAPGSNTEAYLVFRAPLYPYNSTNSPGDSNTSLQALLVPVLNLPSLIKSTNTAATTGLAQFPTSGTEFELFSLGGLGFRELRKNADGQYLFTGGTSDGENTVFGLWQWDGQLGDLPTKLATALPQEADGAWETIFGVPDPIAAGDTVNLAEDNGDEEWYAPDSTGTSKGGLPTGLIKDLGRTFTVSYTAPEVSSSPATMPQGTITNGVGATYGPVTFTANDLVCTASMPCTWSATNLPPGLTIDPNGSSNGQTTMLSGAPTAVKTATATITVSQGGSAQGTQAVTISDIENLTTGIGQDPTGMVADSTDAKVFVAATSSDAVDAIDASANPITATPTTFGFGAGQLHAPMALAYDGTTSLFASNFGNDTVAQAPAAGGTAISDTLTDCTQPEGIAASGGDVFIACYGSDNVEVLTTAGTFVRDISLPGAGGPSGVAPTGVAGTVTVVDSITGDLYAVQSTGTVSTPLALGSSTDPAYVAFASVGGTPYDYVAEPGTGTVAVINETTPTAPTVAGTITLSGVNPPQPYGVATNGTDTLVVSDANNASAHVYTLSATSPFATLKYDLNLPATAVPDGVADMTVGGTQLAFIGDESGDSVTVVDPPLDPSTALGDTGITGTDGSPGDPGATGTGTGTSDGGTGAKGAAPVVSGTPATDPVGTAQPPAVAAAAGSPLAPTPASAAAGTKGTGTTTATKHRQTKHHHARRLRRHAHKRRKRARPHARARRTTHARRIASRTGDQR